MQRLALLILLGLIVSTAEARADQLSVEQVTRAVVFLHVPSAFVTQTIERAYGAWAPK